MKFSPLLLVGLAGAISAAVEPTTTTSTAPAATSCSTRGEFCDNALPNFKCCPGAGSCKPDLLGNFLCRADEVPTSTTSTAPAATSCSTRGEFCDNALPNFKCCPGAGSCKPDLLGNFLCRADEVPTFTTSAAPTVTTCAKIGQQCDDALPNFKCCPGSGLTCKSDLLGLKKCRAATTSTMTTSTKTTSTTSKAPAPTCKALNAVCRQEPGQRCCKGYTCQGIGPLGNGHCRGCKANGEVCRLEPGKRCCKGYTCRGIGPRGNGHCRPT